MTLPRFTFVTSNAEKIQFAKIEMEKHDIQFTTTDVPLLEIQTDSADELILHKAQQAFDLLKSPILVSDHWWNF